MHTVKWLQLLLYNSHNLTSAIYLHTVCSIWPIDMTLSGCTNLGKSWPGSNGNEGVLWIPQIFKSGPSPSACLMSCPGHLLGGVSCPSVEIQLVYFTAPADWARNAWNKS